MASKLSMKNFLYAFVGLMLPFSSFAASLEDGATFSDQLYSYVYSAEKGGVSIAALPAEIAYGDVTLPEIVEYQGETFDVVEVAEKGFNSANITSLTISANIKEIGREAFGYTSLKKVVLDVPGATLETIGPRVFMSCQDLTSIDFPKSLRSLGSDALYRCTALTEVIIPEGVETIQGHPEGYQLSIRNFTFCSSLGLIVLPSTLKDNLLTIGRSPSSYDGDPEVNVYDLINFSGNPVWLTFGYTADREETRYSNYMNYYCWPGVGYYGDSIEEGLKQSGTKDIITFSDVVWGDDFCEFTATPGHEKITLEGLSANGLALQPVSAPVSRAEASASARYRVEGVTREEGLNLACSAAYEGGDVCTRDLTVNADGAVTAIGQVSVSAIGSPAKYYDINGRILREAPESGLYIKVAGGKAEKLVK